MTTQNQDKAMNQRAIVYIDGFNLYYGIRSLKKAPLKWLDVQALAESFLRGSMQLLAVKYCTAEIKGKQSDRIRQQVYLNALATRDKIKIIRGHFLVKGHNCNKCNHYNQSFEEKKTDVNIACEMLADAYEDRCDVAFLVSGDSDLVPAVEKVIEKKKVVIVAIPPNRKSEELNEMATNCFSINYKRIQQCLLPQNITTRKGKTLYMPEEWKR